jgi:methylmalonyl-CoA/ethylmalonyl-CoA epimerase
MLTFHHVGIGTTHFEQAIDRYLELGHVLLLKVDDPGIDVRIAFLRPPGGPLIEIVAPLGENGPLKTLIARKVVPGPYHTCYAVESMLEASDYLRKRGWMPIGQPIPAVAFQGQPVAFFFERDTGLIELVEQPPDL